MDKICSTECTCDKWGRSSVGGVDVGVLADVAEDFRVPHLAQGNFDPVAVSKEVL
jgi:hypothetical protein